MVQGLLTTLSLTKHKPHFRCLPHQGELGFFDFYVIPLAEKLKSCGVFGVSCGEYLNYAKNNRQEWSVRGEEIVAAMLEKSKKVVRA